MQDTSHGVGAGRSLILITHTRYWARYSPGNVPSNLPTRWRYQIVHSSAHTKCFQMSRSELSSSEHKTMPVWPWWMPTGEAGVASSYLLPIVSWLNITILPLTTIVQLRLTLPVWCMWNNYLLHDNARYFQRQNADLDLGWCLFCWWWWQAVWVCNG